MTFYTGAKGMIQWELAMEIALAGVSKLIKHTYTPKRTNYPVVLSLFDKAGPIKVRVTDAPLFKYHFYNGTKLLFQSTTLKAINNLQNHL